MSLSYENAPENRYDASLYNLIWLTKIFSSMSIVSSSSGFFYSRPKFFLKCSPNNVYVYQVLRQKSALSSLREHYNHILIGCWNQETVQY